jgi:signal transduction histidine kinase
LRKKNRREAAPVVRETARRRSVLSVFRVSEWSVRRKVNAVLALTVALAAVFGGMRVSTELKDANAYSTNPPRAGVIGPAIDYLTATERLALPTLLAQATGTDGSTNPRDQYASAEAALTRAAKTADLTPDQKSDVAKLVEAGRTFETGTGTGVTADPSVVMSDMTRNTTNLINSTLNTQGTPDPTVQALIQSLDGRLSLVRQQILIKNLSDGTSQLTASWLAAEIGAESTALDNLSSYFEAKRVATLTSSNGSRLSNITGKNIESLAATPKLFRVYDTLNSRLLSSIQGSLASSASSSKSRALTDSAIILLALLASLLLALFVARALIVPLRTLRTGTLAVARERLPETVARIRAGKEPDPVTPIPVHSHEELGQLARAVDDMHTQAVTLATGEAQLRSQIGAMFVTLSRRNTTLVNQQLALIESLEQDEEDPQRLEQLFSLDHLATRMRRTAESLVILGGSEGRAASFEELSVSDVIHAAVSEVQDYQRVRIDAAPDRLINGRTASDVVHLLAELIDNALSYSPPGSPVTIQAAEDDGKVEIEVVDNGLGMAGEALARANDALKTGGEVTIDTARRMGLFVVSRLAEEHDLKIKLRRNPNGGGIIASILLPASVLLGDGPVEHVSVIDAPPPVEESEATTPVADAEPAEEFDPYLERIEEAIAAVTGLPRRRPGQTPGVATPAPAAAVGMFDASPELPPVMEPAELSSPAPAFESVPDEPVALDEHVDHPDAEVASVADTVSEVGISEAEQPADEEPEEVLAQVVTPDFGGDRRDPADDLADDLADDEPAPPAAGPWAEASSGWGAAISEPEAPAAQADVPVEDEPVVAHAEQPAPVSEDQQPVRLQIRRPLAAAPAASALEGDFVPTSEGSVDSPIFGQLRTNWLSDGGEDVERWSANEVDQGWDAAERAESADAEDTTRTGLPVRRPGGRLLPGGVSQEPAKVVRDPEAIRNRLAAHAAGVSRGRAAAASQTATEEYAHEETGPA